MQFPNRKKIKFFIIPLIIASLIFIFYQLIIFSQLSSMKSTTTLKGVHEYHDALYIPSDKNQFQCIFSKEKIDFDKVNDDYCDCKDSSDEPGTNACPNANFFCASRSTNANFKRVITSSKVNDGICDCCDGSDEYKNKVLKFRLGDAIQEQIGRFMSPCKNLCEQEVVINVPNSL